MLWVRISTSLMSTKQLSVYRWVENWLTNREVSWITGWLRVHVACLFCTELLKVTCFSNRSPGIYWRWPGPPVDLVARTSPPSVNSIGVNWFSSDTIQYNQTQYFYLKLFYSSCSQGSVERTGLKLVITWILIRWRDVCLNIYTLMIRRYYSTLQWLNHSQHQRETEFFFTVTMT